ncbi:MAG: MopE-related protein [Kofleriaceae bacterium]|nr:MopE-related protein [Kofleriaceae bacterium]
MKLLPVVALLVGATVNLSCNVNEYCLNCATGGDGGNGDGGTDADDGGVGDGDDGDAGPCVPTGTEVCDGKDNDCNGQTDEGTLPEVGQACGNQQGECAGGVKQCTNGAIVCSKPPLPEACDLKDNDCDNNVDEGDPGGGALCGTNTGECVAGANTCMNGQIVCVGAIGTVGGQQEICNNRDDDCDGQFDENLTLGPCVAGDDGPSEGNVGQCKLGTRQCVGGTTVCVGAVFPTFELCDTTLEDSDCNGQPSNGYNTQTDPQNCGGCGLVCNLDNAFEGCANGACTIAACEPNYFNNDGMVGNGCEFNCGHPFLGNEVCNNVDDDCDGLVDGADPDMVVPTGLCDSDGACSTMTTLTCNGAAGWVCNYNNPNVQKDGMGNLIPETRCDSDIVAGVFADNDCDGKIDEGQANLGAACNNGGAGDCRSTGTFTCDPANRDGGAAICTFTQVGPGQAAFETCDGRDNDCDAKTDEGAAAGNLAGQEWVTIPGITPAVQIMKYEASRPDATLTTGGTTEVFACSRKDVQPWTNVKYSTAEAACTSIGARLCTEAEWQSMCMPRVTYPVTGPLTTAPNDFVFIEAENFFANTTIPAATPARAWASVAPLSFNGITAMQVPDNNFAVTDAANALTQSSRLDYQLSLAASTTYRSWLRMRSPTGGTGANPYGVHTPATATLAPQSDASTGVGDLIIVSTFTNGSSGIPTHTLQSGFTQLVSRGNDDGNNDVRLSIAYRVATTAGAQTYQAYTSSSGSNNYTGITVIRAGRYDLARVVVAETDNDGNGAPNPPGTGVQAGPYFVLAIGAWHLGSSQTVAVSPPGSFTEAWEMTGSNQGEMSVAVGTSADPGSFTDDVTPNNTISVAIAIRALDPSNASVWVGLNAGTSAGTANATPVVARDDNQWVWEVGPALTTTAAGVYTFSVYTRTDGAMIDTIALSRQATTSPTLDEAWAYQSNPRTAQPTTCNADAYDTDTSVAGDQDGVLATGALAACFANQTGTDDAFDMSGNVKEWTKARATGQNPLRGGAANNETSGTTCGLNFTSANDTFFFPNVGFRCCR